MATWPVTLPDNFLVDSYQEAFSDNVLRTSMSVGPAKMRRRSTAGTRPISGNQYMTPDHLGIFDIFFTTTLEDGALRFDWTHPRTGVSVEFRFLNAPQFERVKTQSGVVGWIVAINLEIMP